MRCRFHHLLYALLLFLLWALDFSASAQEMVVTNSSFALTNAAQIRALTPTEAAKKLPVRLQVVVIDNELDGRLAIKDDSAGLYAVAHREIVTGLHRGDLIQLDGISNPGEFAPYVDVLAIRKLGAGEVPAPQIADPEALFSGQLDAQWIEVSGIVRRSTRIWNGWSYFEMNVEPGGGRVLVLMQGNEEVKVDSAVRVRAVCYYQVNKSRQVLRPHLSIPIGESIVVTKPAVTNLDAIPVRPISSLMQFSVGEDASHRVHLRGTVIYSLPGEEFWLSDGGRGLRVLCDSKEPLHIGMEMDVFGFLKRGEYGPLLEDAVFEKRGKILAVSPKRLDKMGDALDHPSELIECKAVIQEQWQALDGIRMRLSDGTNEFSALLHLTTETAPPDWKPGARVRVTGVCNVGFRNEPTTPGTLAPQFFEILLRSTSDVEILQHPSWWNGRHVAWLTSCLAALLLLAVGIVAWIGHWRLRQEALERMKSEVEFAAVWNERNRMAREIHDTLAQGLSAISMQLEVLKRHLPPETKPRELLDVARSLVREKMADARNAIWNVRSQVLETGDLGCALKGVLRNLTEDTETKGELRVRGRKRRLSPVVENNLLRIGQEAITNAAKYAAARNILVTLDFEERQLRMTIADDGKGFNVSSPPPSEGGFGLNGMRERAGQIHAEFSVASEHGEGTIISLVLPLST